MQRSAWVLGVGLAIACGLLAQVNIRLARSEKRQQEFTRAALEALDRLGAAHQPLPIGHMQHIYTWTSGGQRRTVTVTKDENGPETLPEFETRAAKAYLDGKNQWPPD